MIDLRNPGGFSIHLQSVEMMESLKNITKELQKAYSSSFAAEYKPEIGELCAVKFSLDRVRQFIYLFFNFSYICQNNSDYYFCEISIIVPVCQCTA